MPGQTPESLPAPAPRLPPSALALIGANAIPLVGVFLFHWTVFTILVLYWCENVVIGVFNILRIVFAQPQTLKEILGKLIVIPFFAAHYGGFTAAHGAFLRIVFGPRPISFDPASLLALMEEDGLWYGVVAVAVSHGFSFVHNYLGAGEFRKVSPDRLMTQPYIRVVVLHVTILVGGLAAMGLGSPVAALVVLIVIKTVVDLRAHLAERRKLGREPGSVSSA